ncbi:MAG TPA: response regulator [Syntrophales bacterium]|nr:response regulator [Syntrophales bacterium]
MNAKKILVVEDEWIVGDQICRNLRSFGYDSQNVAASAVEAFALIEEAKPDLVLMDIVLPGELDGIEAAERIRSRYDLPVIFLTAHTDGDYIFRAKQTRPFGYLIKPFNKMELHTNIEMALHRHQLEKELQDCKKKLDLTLQGVIDALTEITEMRGPHSAGHHQRVKKLAIALAAELGMNGFQAEGVGLAASVYDIGLINVPMEVIQDTSRLTGIKLSLYRTYPTIGYGILKKIDFSWPIADIVLQHREYYDGTGFPRGMKGEEILQEARILAVADALEELTSHRIYQRGLPQEEALTVIRNHSGSRYDPEVVAACLRLFNEKGFRTE